jgi:hypothetical protein
MNLAEKIIVYTRREIMRRYLNLNNLLLIPGLLLLSGKAIGGGAF